MNTNEAKRNTIESQKKKKRENYKERSEKRKLRQKKAEENKKKPSKIDKSGENGKTNKGQNTYKNNIKSQNKCRKRKKVLGQKNRIEKT